MIYINLNYKISIIGRSDSYKSFHNIGRGLPQKIQFPFLILRGRGLSCFKNRFEGEFGYFRPIIKDVVERYLDCGNPRSGFARIRCPDCAEERLVMFSCRTRGFCPSCHAKRLEEWSEWMREMLLLNVLHRQIVFTIPKKLRVFFKFDGGLPGRSLPLRPPLSEPLLRDGDRERASARGHRRHPDLWGPDQSSRAPPFSGDRGRGGQGGGLP